MTSHPPRAYKSGPLAMRDRFRRHWQEGDAFYRACNLMVRRWDPDGVEMHLPFRDDLGLVPGPFMEASSALSSTRRVPQR